VPIRWDLVRKHARNGATEEEIVRALEISDEVLAAPAIQEQLRRLIDVWHARYKVALRARIKRRAFTGKGGGANTLSLAARNHLGWDRPAPPQEFGNFPLELARAFEALEVLVLQHQRSKTAAPATRSEGAA
jgi:hypothetical protein